MSPGYSLSVREAFIDRSARLPMAGLRLTAGDFRFLITKRQCSPWRPCSRLSSIPLRTM